MTNQYWLVKSEPDAYAWDDLVREGRTSWDGVRNYQARNHLQSMRAGDRVLFYESVTTRAVCGECLVTKEASPDLTASEPGWVAVELRAVRPLRVPVTLGMIKADPQLSGLALLRQSRLSVMPLTRAGFLRIVRLGRG